MTHAVIGTIEIQPGARAEVLKAVLAHRERSLRDEPGTIQFEVLVPQNDPDKLLLYEVYSDAAAFAVHMKGASMGRVQSEIGSKVLRLSGIPCTPGAEF